MTKLGYKAAILSFADKYAGLFPNISLPVDVLVWMLWIHHSEKAEYIWVDQCCIPQDASDVQKMEMVRQSPSIYSTGKVFMLVSPVVDYDSGNIVNQKIAESILSGISNMSGRDKSCAIKSLMVNVSYYRRAWTVQEAIVANTLESFPLLGSGLKGFQPLHLVDWPDFNSWNGKWGVIRDQIHIDKAIQSYFDGDYTGIIKKIKSDPKGFHYLAIVAKELLWGIVIR